jgi:hypothetical protein
VKFLEDLSAGFGAADCYFTVAKPVGDQVAELASMCSVQLPKLIKANDDGAIAVHAKSLAALLKLAKQPPVVPASPPTPKPQPGGVKKPPTPPVVDPNEPGSATSDDNAAI